MGYRNKTGPAGTRNLLGIVTTVQCAAGVLKVAVERIKKELLPKYPHVDGVVAVTHPYGCGVAINAPMAEIPIRAITNLIHHPNFGGEIMVVGLGCEKLTYDRVLPPEDITCLLYTSPARRPRSARRPCEDAAPPVPDTWLSRPFRRAPFRQCGRARFSVLYHRFSPHRKKTSSELYRSAIQLSYRWAPSVRVTKA